MISDIKLGVLSVVAGLCLAFAGAQTFKLSAERTAHAAERTAHAETRTTHAEQRTEWERLTRVAVEAARTEEQRRATALQGVIDEAEQNLARARADADAAGDAGERLRKRLAQLTATCSVASSDPGASGAGPTAEATGDLLAYVQRRLDEASDGIAKFADKAHPAGIACQRSYEALTPRPLSR